ncbi:MAG: M67 family metallopeptidase [Lachnospiraceae bacterium]|nr:M67 family metallopeptidase [Lachnospiraceae bacterium]
MNRYDIEGIVIDSLAYERIKEHSEREYPREGCGMLLSQKQDGPVTDVYTADNNVNGAAGSVRFTIDPFTVYRLEKKADEEGLTVSGFFHSHPDQAAVPSDEDMEYMIPGLAYMIFSVGKNGCRDVRGYIREASGGEVRELQISIKR